MEMRTVLRSDALGVHEHGHVIGRVALWSGVLVVVAGLLWAAIAAGANPDPLTAEGSTAVLDIGVLVFREGLECILVLAAITASRATSGQPYRRPIAAGAVLGFVATLITWRIAVGIVDALTESIPALHVQAATGLLAVVVLVIVMNWFFHKLYWTGWISLHTKKKRELLKNAADPDASRVGLLLGLGFLGFTSFYREGFEVVLFLQNYRLELGGTPVLYGVLVGSAFSAVVAVLTFVANRRLPYKKMLVLTGVLLGVVLLVMVGEQAQEMQLANWLPTTELPSLARVIPDWMGLWFAVFPTVETLAAQGIALLLVLGSYLFVRVRVSHRSRPETEASAA